MLCKDVCFGNPEGKDNLERCREFYRLCSSAPCALMRCLARSALSVSAVTNLPLELEAIPPAAACGHEASRGTRRNHLNTARRIMRRGHASDSDAKLLEHLTGS